MHRPILSLDTATRRCSVALSAEGRVLAFREEESERLTHAERLNVFIDEVMAEAGLGLSDLAAVAVGVGPGSYTGLRIGLSAAKGLCYALDIPILGLGTLEVLVQELLATTGELPADAWLMPMIDARRMEVFTLRADARGRVLVGAHPQVLDEAWRASLPEDRTTVVFGDGADKATALWTVPGIRHVPGIRPSHRGLTAWATTLFNEGRTSDLAYLVPDYGKPANVTAPRKGSA